MPNTIPVIRRSDSAEIERLNNQYLGQYKYTPDLSAALAARVKQGFDNSTGKVIYDLIARPSAKNDPKVPVKQLYLDYPDMHWEEPMTRDQAEWRSNHMKVRAQTQDIIDKREQGAVATGLGLTASFGTAMLMSPESYFAPVVGGLSSAAAARVASAVVTSKKGFKIGSALKTARATKATAKQAKTASTLVSSASPEFAHSSATMGLAKIAQFQNKHRFVAGFAEDAALTAAFTENLFASREEMLGNPQSARDYMTNVLLAGTLSGLLNSGAGRIIDRVAMSKEVEYRAAELVQLSSGSKVPITTPEARKIARDEWKITRALGSWRANNKFDGEVVIGHRPESDFTSGYNKNRHAIHINTAKLKKERDVIRALDNAMIDAEVPEADLPDFKTKVGPTGIETADGAKLPDLREELTNTNPTNPHTAYNLADPKENGVAIERERIVAETPDANAKPVETADSIIEPIRKAVGEEVDADGVVSVKQGHEYSSVIQRLDTEMESRRKIADINIGHALGIASLLHNTSVAKSFPNASDADRFAVKLLQDSGYNPKTLKTANIDEVTSTLKAKVDDMMKEESLRVFRQIEADNKWGLIAESGRGDLHGALDGSLVSGGTFFSGQGDNTYRRMETYRSRYSNLIHNVAIEHGVSDFIEKYDDAASVFWKDVDKSLNNLGDVSPEAKAMADAYREIAEHQRIMLNRQGAGINKYDGFFLSTVHNRAKIVSKENEWRAFMMHSDNVDWHRMGYEGDASDVAARQEFLDVFFEEVDGGFHHDTQINKLVAGGKKGQGFANTREIHFKPGKQTAYNDSFGRQNTAKELLDQMELRAKAIAITETMGPDTKATFKTIARSEAYAKMNKSQKAQFKWHWDEMTGETNTVVSQPIATAGQGYRNLVNAMVLHGTGVTVAATDPISQIVNLRTSGLSTSLGRAARHVYDSYGEAINSIVRGRDTVATKRIKMSILPHDTNLQSTRIVMGDSSIGHSGNLPERLSLATIKWSGAGIFTKISQMSSVIGMQRRMSELISAGNWGDDFTRQLSRFDVSPEEFLSLKRYKVDDQISVYGIEDTGLRQKMTNFLDEGMRLGSLQADPRQTSLTKIGSKSGTVWGEGVRSVTQYLPAALAQHQKLLMRLAVMGGGDARFTSLIERSRIAEVATVLGMMLGSATMVVTLKDVLRNKEPFWTGDQPFNDEHMWRVLKVSGIVPLITEFGDTARGGMLGQMSADAYKILDSAGEGDVWQTANLARRSSPLVFTNLGPAPVMLETLIGMVSEEYLRDTQRRLDTVERMSGQSPIIKF